LHVQKPHTFTLERRFGPIKLVLPRHILFKCLYQTSGHVFVLEVSILTLFAILIFYYGITTLPYYFYFELYNSLVGKFNLSTHDRQSILRIVRVMVMVKQHQISRGNYLLKKMHNIVI